MPLEATTLAQQTAFAVSYGRPKMAVHTPYQKSLSDDRPYYSWNTYMYQESENIGTPRKQTDPLTEISMLSILRLVLHYVKALKGTGFNDLAFALPIFGKTLKFLLSSGVDVEKISVTHTVDNSVLVKGVAAGNSFYFETYFDEVEYKSGYEIISNVFANNEMIASSAGSIDFVLENSKV